LRSWLMIWDGLANARGGQRAMQCLAIQWNTMQCLAIQCKEGRGATYNTDSRIYIGISSNSCSCLVETSSSYHRNGLTPISTCYPSPLLFARQGFSFSCVITILARSSSISLKGMSYDPFLFPTLNQNECLWRCTPYLPHPIIPIRNWLPLSLTH